MGMKLLFLLRNSSANEYTNKRNKQQQQQQKQKQQYTSEAVEKCGGRSMVCMKCSCSALLFSVFLSIRDEE